LQNIAIYCNNQ